MPVDASYHRFGEAAQPLEQTGIVFKTGFDIVRGGTAQIGTGTEGAIARTGYANYPDSRVCFGRVQVGQEKRYGLEADGVALGFAVDGESGPRRCLRW